MRKGHYTGEQALLHLFRDSVRYIRTAQQMEILAEQAEALLELEPDDTSLQGIADMVNKITKENKS